MPEWYMTPKGTKLPTDLVSDLRYVAGQAGFTKYSDDWLFEQVRTLRATNDPTQHFIAYPQRDGAWGGWLVPCHPGEGIPYDFDSNGDPVSWGLPIKRTGATAESESWEWKQTEQHVAAAWALYRAMNPAVCENCHGNKNLDTLSGFWADTGKENAGLTSSPFRRSQRHYDCPVCAKYRAAGHGKVLEWEPRGARPMPDFLEVDEAAK